MSKLDIKAAIRAGYSEKTANQIGAENLAKPSIKSAVAERMADRDHPEFCDAIKEVRFELTESFRIIYALHNLFDFIHINFLPGNSRTRY